MRILLAGEASGTHRNLRKGLRALGHDCDLLTHFEFDRAAESDLRLDVPGQGLGAALLRNISPLTKLLELESYDVISLCNTITLVSGSLMRHAYADLAILRKKTQVLSYFGLGCDELSLIAEHGGRLPYTPCETCLQFDTGGAHCRAHLRPYHQRATELAKRHFDCAASMAVEYDHARRIVPTDRFFRIGLPVDTEAIPFEPSRERGPLLIAHTPTRRGFKGTAQVLDAIQLLRNRRQDFEFVILEGLGHQAYLERVGQVDIVIDQVFSQSAGMNALECISMGKLVLTGATLLGTSYLSPSGPHPAVDASPDPAQLARTLEEILRDWHSYRLRALAGRSFVETNHGIRPIAGAFERAWTGILGVASAHPHS